MPAHICVFLMIIIKKVVAVQKIKRMTFLIEADFLLSEVWTEFYTECFMRNLPYFKKTWIYNQINFVPFWCQLS